MLQSSASYKCVYRLHHPSVIVVLVVWSTLLKLLCERFRFHVNLFQRFINQNQIRERDFLWHFEVEFALTWMKLFLHGIFTSHFSKEEEKNSSHREPWARARLHEERWSNWSETWYWLKLTSLLVITRREETRMSFYDFQAQQLCVSWRKNYENGKEEDDSTRERINPQSKRCWSKPLQCVLLC